MLLKIMLAVLTHEELVNYCREDDLQNECHYLLGELSVNPAIANGIMTVRKLSVLRQKDMGWEAIGRINSIVDLCNGK